MPRKKHASKTNIHGSKDVGRKLNKKAYADLPTVLNPNSKQDREALSVIDTIAKQQSAIATIPEYQEKLCKIVVRDAINKLNVFKQGYVFYSYQIDSVKEVYPNAIVKDLGSGVYVMTRATDKKGNKL